VDENLKNLLLIFLFSSSRMKGLEMFQIEIFSLVKKENKETLEVGGWGGNWLELFHFFFIDHQWRFPHLRLFFWQAAFEFRERDQGIKIPLLSLLFFLSFVLFFRFGPTST